MKPTATSEKLWPPLPYAEWKEALDTLHMWTQIVGKVKLGLAPFLNQWWHVAFDITARGLTTSSIPWRDEDFEVNFDFIDHKLYVVTSTGSIATLPLAPRSVATFYGEFMETLRSLGVTTQIWTMPVEVPDPIPFGKDNTHAAYDPDYVNRWWRITLQTKNILERFRSSFCGKSSPIGFFWGSFDLCETRFSGRRGPEKEWPKGMPFMPLAMDEEHISVGFWPGSPSFPHPAFYSYTYPEPPGCRTASVDPGPAGYEPNLGEFVLLYEDARRSASPEDAILDFFKSTYEAGANLGQWDRAALERDESYYSRKSSST